MKVLFWLLAMWFCLAVVKFYEPSANLLDYSFYFVFIYSIVFGFFKLIENIKNIFSQWF